MPKKKAKKVAKKKEIKKMPKKTIKPKGIKAQPAPVKNISKTIHKCAEKVVEPILCVSSSCEQVAAVKGYCMNCARDLKVI